MSSHQNQAFILLSQNNAGALPLFGAAEKMSPDPGSLRATEGPFEFVSFFSTFKPVENDKVNAPSTLLTSWGLGGEGGREGEGAQTSP